MNGAGDTGFVFVDVDVDFAAQAEIRQVDAGFDGVAGAGDQMADVVSFEAVHVDAIAVNGFPEAVAGAVSEIFAVAGFFDDGAGSFVDLPAL